MDLSIIITNYNYTHFLDGLLTNIADQKLTSFEVIIVDDCSEQSCKGIVDRFSESFPCTLVQNEQRCYTKESRLRGVEHASGKFITFIDADDKFYGNHSLKYHLQLAMDNDVDIVHFNSLSLYKGRAIRKKNMLHAFPLGDKLSGGEIFGNYVSNRLNGHLIWGKIYKKSLWERCLAPARLFDVRRYREDVFLSTLLFFYAKSYLGSHRIGYQRDFEPTGGLKSFGRLSTGFIILEKLIPFLLKEGASVEDCEKLRDGIISYMVDDLVTLMKSEYKNSQKGLCRQNILNEFLEHTTIEDVPRILLSSLFFFFGEQLKEEGKRT